LVGPGEMIRHIAKQLKSPVSTRNDDHAAAVRLYGCLCLPGGAAPTEEYRVDRTHVGAEWGALRFRKFSWSFLERGLAVFNIIVGSGIAVRVVL
jgi:hypothetical protein